MLENHNIAKFFKQEMPIKVKPYQHQQTAFLFALKVMGYIPSESISTL